MVGKYMAGRLVGIVDVEGAVIMLLFVVVMTHVHDMHGRVLEFFGERGRPGLRHSRYGLPRQAKDEEDRGYEIAHGPEYTENGLGCESFAIRGAVPRGRSLVWHHDDTSLFGSSPMEYLFLITLILLNGIFAMSEIALVTAKRGRLARLAEDGDGSAAIALKLHDEPTRFLSTIQIGITSIGILNGVIGEAVLADPFAVWMVGIGMDKEFANILSTAIVVVVITYLSIVVGELVPKRIGQFDPEGIARMVARPMQALSVVTRPFVRLLTISTDTLLALMGKRQHPGQGVTEEEIHALIEEGSEAGVIEDQEHQMVRNVFRLDDRQVTSLMIPRSDIVFFDVNLPLDENLRRFAESEHSRFPVCRGGLHDVLGVINARQMFSKQIKGGAIDLAAQVQPAVFVPESLNGMDLLRHFRASASPMVLVVDEYGEVLGMVTLQDVLEAVTGEFKPRT